MQTLRMYTERSGISDALQRLAAGQDSAAWALLVERCGPATERLARRLCHDTNEAQDAWQEAWLQIRDGAARFRPMGEDPDAGAWGWIMRVTANACLKWQRRTRRQALPRFHGGTDVANEPDEVMDDELAAGIRRSLATLPEEQRSAVVLHVVEGMDFATMAAAFGCSVAAVKMRVYRGIERLREQLPSTALSGVALPALLMKLPEIPGHLDPNLIGGLLQSSSTAALGSAPAVGSAATKTATGIAGSAVLAGGALAVVAAGALVWGFIASPREPAPAPGAPVATGLPAAPVKRAWTLP